MAGNSTPDETSAAADDSTPRGGKTGRYVFAFLALACIALLLWAWFSPPNDCDLPSCARQRYSVALEIDALGHIEPISLEVTEGNARVSIESILRDGGIQLVPVVDQTGLPYDATSGPLDRADLFQFVSAWRGGTVEGMDATLYALFVNSLIADNGEQLFGIMFDTAGREGFAVAPRTTERLFREHAPELIATLQLRTFAHELLHALNRAHGDAVQTVDGRLTLEAPTRCISRKEKTGWSLLEPPLLELSPRTIRFFQTADPREVLPGRDNSPFAHGRASPSECDDARAQVVESHSRWTLAARRLKQLLPFRTAEGAESEPESDVEPDPESDAESEPTEAALAAEVRLQAQPATYPLGYPIAVRVTVDNSGEESLPIAGRLNPQYGMLQIEYREAGAEAWQALQPLDFFEPTNNADALLPPGARTEETVPIYYGQEGWTFGAAGEYEIRARLQLGASAEDIASAPQRISIGEPTTTDDREALQPLLDAEGQLADDIGRLLYFGGRIGDRDDLEPLEATIEKFGHTALGGALRLTLLSHRLRKPIDPTTGLRPPPDFQHARKLLEDTCADSGIAAMTSDVLEQRPGSMPEALSARAETNAAAWDGMTPARGTLATYSDPLLKRHGPSLHFCFNESELRRPVRQAATKLARQLRRERPSRIVLVGHSDSAGTCGFNESLAMQRAREVQRALVAAGLRRTPIEIVSIGERRPVSFVAAADAQQLNRRVEILVESAAEQTSDDAAPVIPKCPNLPPQPGRLVIASDRA